ncbi:DNA mismatch repair protein MutL [Thermoclostridium stercorarium subsp. leptospartum DSM 9219]|uniref:DNA mismatch repair protein MutL n=1 Tax=Thermoclostridium stercorarium subsp. leptospartum DSM 9219 TaxID=1346611 RepID=A0A1B1YJ45_THEST|nr:DNA mismatch repair endonuclease MutL [Thermoclostridium stercorarium]ANX00810.1 DNA mismatch repair protein MutL [Thermoclostridium stercorarium subsp. leptospartum DSM 9219]
MGKVVILDENTANQIAAGEVIERPASVVKEMVENAIDAHATSITVEITNGGVKSIKIVDNGDGIEGDDVELAFERHATSKIRSIDDLTRLSTMGFRGEALASIAAVSKVEVITKTEDAKTGTRVIVEGGKVVLSEPTGAPKGTTFIVRELFYNTPARYKFLKKDTTEATYIHDVISKIALARPDISIKFVNQGKTVIHTPGNHDLLSTVYSLFGKDTARAVIPVNLTFNGVKVSGFVGKPEISRGNRNLEMVFVNGRVVYNRTIITAIEEAYKTRLMQKRFPFTVLKVDVPPETVDVNVHPAKLEVRFSDENMVYRTVYMAVSDALSGASLIQSIEEEDGSEIFSFGEVNIENKPEQTKMQLKPVIRPAPSDAFIRAGEHSGKIESARKNDDIRKESSESNIPGESLHVKEITESPVRKEEYKQSHKAEVRPNDNISRETKTAGAVARQAGTDTDKEAGDDRERLLNARIIGQAFDSYIILEEGEDVFVIDQHAAHERIRFETLREWFVHEEAFSQGLLSPVMVELTQQEMHEFTELEPYIIKLGFEAEVFGNRTVLVRAIPYLLTEGFSDRDFRDILGKLSEETRGVLEIIPEETIYMMACKSAIKANRPMSEMEIQSLVRELVKCENPYTCVHGRPVIISISKKELEKKFKRII